MRYWLLILLVLVAGLIAVQVMLWFSPYKRLSRPWERQSNRQQRGYWC